MMHLQSILLTAFIILVPVCFAEEADVENNNTVNIPISNQHWVTYRVAKNDSVSTIFARLNIPSKQLYQVMQAGEQTQYLTQIQPGQILRFQLDHHHLLRLILDKSRKRSAIEFYRSASSDAFISRFIEPTFHRVTNKPANTKAPVNTAKTSLPKVKQRSKEQMTYVEKRYQQAVRSRAEGNIKLSIQHLTEVIQLEPENLTARVMLSALLITHHDALKAADLLEEGLQYHPDHHKLIPLLVGSHIEANDLTSAIRVLEQHLSVEQNTKLAAMLAALYDKTERHSLAIRRYRQILMLEPSQPTWWMGIGIAYESNQQQLEAIQAYDRAISLGSLAQPGLQFVLNRKRQLGKNVALRRIQ